MHDCKNLCCTMLNPIFWGSSYHFHMQLLSKWHLYCQPLVIYPKGIRQFIEWGYLKWFNMWLLKWWTKNPILEIYTLLSIMYGTHYPFYTFFTHSSKIVWLHSNAKFVVYPHVFKIMCGKKCRKSICIWLCCMVHITIAMHFGEWIGWMLAS